MGSLNQARVKIEALAGQKPLSRRVFRLAALLAQPGRVQPTPAPRLEGPPARGRPVPDAILYRYLHAVSLPTSQVCSPSGGFKIACFLKTAAPSFALNRRLSQN